jgi:hypothetical protein
MTDFDWIDGVWLEVEVYHFEQSDVSKLAGCMEVIQQTQFGEHFEMGTIVLFGLS